MSRWKPIVAAALLCLGVSLAAEDSPWRWVGIVALGVFVGMTYAEIERGGRR